MAAGVSPNQLDYVSSEDSSEEEEDEVSFRGRSTDVDDAVDDEYLPSNEDLSDGSHPASDDGGVDVPATPTTRGMSLVQISMLARAGFTDEQIGQFAAASPSPAAPASSLGRNLFATPKRKRGADEDGEHESPSVRASARRSGSRASSKRPSRRGPVAVYEDDTADTPVKKRSRPATPAQPGAPLTPKTSGIFSIIRRNLFGRGGL